MLLAPDSCHYGYSGAPAAVHGANGLAATTNSAPTARPLPARQMEVARLAASGLSNKAIGRRLGIAEATVKEHLRKVRAALGISRRFELPKAVQPATAPKVAADHSLTARQTEVVALIADGVSGIEIARRLGVNEGTIKAHVKCIRKSLNVTTRTAMVAWYVAKRTQAAVAAGQLGLEG